MASTSINSNCGVTSYYRPVPNSDMLKFLSSDGGIIIRHHSYPITRGLRTDCNGHVLSTR